MTEFDIYGTHIPYCDIKDYKIVQREYIYRPSYREKSSPFGKIFSKGEYEFDRMLPYAAILTKEDSDYKLAVKNVNVTTVKSAILKDIAVGALSAFRDKMNRKRFHCKNVAGRCFTTFLDDIPTVIIRNDGKISDVYKNDSLYPLLGEPIAPTIMIVPAMSIETKNEQYLFFGNRIQLNDVESEYIRLRNEMEFFKENNSQKKKPVIEIKNVISEFLPKVSKKSLPEESSSSTNNDELNEQ